MDIERFDNQDPQLALIHLSRRLGQKLAMEHRQRLHELLLDISVSYDAIAEELIPESVAISVGGARSIIRAAAMLIFSDQEYRENVHQRYKRQGTINAAASGLGTGDSIRKSLEKRGEIPWTKEERELLMELCADPSFQHPPGSASAGKPKYELIRSFLNDVFHDGKPVRSLNTVNGMRTYFSGKADPHRTKRARNEWSEEETRRLEELVGTCMKKNPALGPDFALIAQKLNEEFHLGELQSGVCIRKSELCFKRLEYLGIGRVKRRRFAWSEEESNRLLELSRIHFHESGPQYGSPNYDMIAKMLNEEFYSVELEKGDAIRTVMTCSAKIYEMRKLRKMQPITT